MVRLDAPPAATFRPGQFLHLLTAEPGQQDPLLRRPISILRGGGAVAARPSGRSGAVADQPAGRGATDTTATPPATAGEPGGAGTVAAPVLTRSAQGRGGSASRPRPGEVDILLKTVGRGTDWLARRRPGDTVDTLGPLGSAFPEVKPGQRLLLVGGGVGIVPLVAAADLAVARGHEVVLAFGARGAPDVPAADLLDSEVEYRVTTEDGSLGAHGRVTALLPELLPWADVVFACGPNPMLRAVTEHVRDRRNPGRPKPLYLALEEHMGCAMGVCLGCVVETRQGYQRVCREGPVFPAETIVW